jgi:hypothetical protein
MKKKLAALAGVVAILAASLSFVGTPKAGAVLQPPGQGSGSCVWYYTGSGNVWVLVCGY